MKNSIKIIILFEFVPEFLKIRGKRMRITPYRNLRFKRISNLRMKLQTKNTLSGQFFLDILF